MEILDAETGAVVGAFGRRGQGPGEFINPPKVVPGRGPQTAPAVRAWLFDSYQGRLTLADLSGLAVLDSVDITLEEHAWDLAWIEDSLLVGAGRDSANAFRIFDTNGRVLRRIRADRTGFEKVPQPDIQSARHNVMCVDPQGSRLALAYRWASRVEIYSTQGHYLGRARTPHAFVPWIDRHPLKRIPVFHTGSPNVRAAYYDCAATDTHVFALFSGRLHKDFRRKQHQCWYVHVFDWSGNLVRVIRLDHGASSVAVDRHGSRLYTTDASSVTPAIRTIPLRESEATILSQPGEDQPLRNRHRGSPEQSTLASRGGRHRCRRLRRRVDAVAESHAQRAIDANAKTVKGPLVVLVRHIPSSPSSTRARSITAGVISAMPRSTA
jgi:hypothetical protein